MKESKIYLKGNIRSREIRSYTEEDCDYCDIKKDIGSIVFSLYDFDDSTSRWKGIRKEELNCAAKLVDIHNKTEEYTEIEGTLLDDSIITFQFDLPEEVTSRIGEHICQIFISFGDAVRTIESFRYICFENEES